MDTQTLQNNLAEVNGKIAAAAQRSGRAAEDVLLVAVSKTHPPRILQAALSLGLYNLGENRIQEAVEKVETIEHPGLRWHFIGHLQTNKVKQAVGRFALIHGVDRMKLARELDKRACEAGTRERVLLEVNVSGEESKHGFTPETLPGRLDELGRLAGLEVVGLMTMAPFVADPEETRPVFRRLRELRDRLREKQPEGMDLRELSMGMTNDYPVAIEEGATIVRVGTALFGERQPR